MHDYDSMEVNMTELRKARARIENAHSLVEVAASEYPELTALIEGAAEDLEAALEYLPDPDQGDYQRGRDMGSNPNYAAYYANGESEEFASGFVDGRVSLYSSVEDDAGAMRNPYMLRQLTGSDIQEPWGAIRLIEKMEEE